MYFNLAMFNLALFSQSLDQISYAVTTAPLISLPR